MPKRTTRVSAHPAPSVAASSAGHHRASFVFMDRRDALRAVAHAVLHACVVEKLTYVFLAGNAFVAEGPTRKTNRVGTQLALHRNPALFAALDHAQTVGEGAEDPLFVLRYFTLQKSQPVLPKLGVAEHLMNLRLLQRFLALGTVQFA